MPIEKNIDVDLLSVDLANFRLGEFDDVRSAYQAMLEEQKDKLVALAADILENGLSPAERLIVVPDEDEPKHFVVCEGNRRLTAIKFMSDPRLTASSPQYGRFAELSKLFHKKPIRSLPCVVLASKEEAFEWIERKHNPKDGKGLVQWGSVATGRAEAYRGRVRASKAVVDFLKSKSAISGKLERAVRGKTTNLDRVLQMPYMASTLGVKISKSGGITFENGDEAQGTKLLRSIVERITADGFSVNDIRSKGQRWSLIDEFAADNCLGPPQAPSTGSTKAVVAGPKGRLTKLAPDQNSRTMLALTGSRYVLKISDKRLAELYKEARDINVATLTNSAAVLCRVFLELATDHFLKFLNVPLPQRPAQQLPWKDWSDKGLQLETKIRRVLNVLDPSGKSKDLVEARKGISSQDAIHYINSMHEFVHNLAATPHDAEVKKIWEKWHGYFECIFVEVEKALAKQPKP